MKATIILRDKLGLSQNEMARYLSVTRSQLAMYEKGQRDLPTAAMLKLAEIELFLQQPVTPKKIARPHVKAQQTKTRQILHKHAMELDYKTQLTQRKLDTAKKKYAQKMLLLDVVDHLIKMNKKSSADMHRHPAFLKIMEAEAHKSLDENGLHLQALLQVQINGLRTQHEHALSLMF